MLRQYKLCKHCGKDFLARDIKQYLCSKQCSHNYYYPCKKVNCANCNKELLDWGHQRRSKIGKVFCKDCKEIKRKLRYSLERDKDIAMATQRYYVYKNNSEYVQRNKERGKRWHEEHKDEVKIKTKEYSLGEARPKILANKREYNAKPINKKRKREWLENNKDKINLNRQEYRSGKGKMICKLISNRRRRKLDNIIHKFTAQDLVKKLDDTKGFCQECKKYIGKDYLTLEHIMPLSRVSEGHIYNIEDVEFWCASCNNTKRAKTYDEWRDYKNAVLQD